MTDDAAFENELRAMLAARDPGPAPTGLAVAIERRVGADRPVVRWARWPQSIGPLVGGSLVAAVLLVVLVLARPVATGPGASPSQIPSVPYAVEAGDGVVSAESVPLAQAAAGLIVVIALARLYRTTTVRWRRIGAALGILGVGLVALNIGTSDALSHEARNGGGVEALDPGGIDPTGGTGFYVDVTGDQPFRLDFTIANASRLPLEVMGMAAPTEVSDRFPRLVGMGILTDTSQNLDTAARRPFQPTVLMPDEALDLTFVGRAGICATRPVDGLDGGGSSISQVVIVYEQLTIRHSATIALPEPVNVAFAPGGC